MKVVGIKAKCRDMEYLHGLMGRNMMGIIIWIRRKDMGFLFGLMGGNMRGSG